MKRFVASMTAAALMTGAMAIGAMVSLPALAQGGKPTELVELGGKSVDSMLLRYQFDSTWVIDKSHILLRDTYRDHYFITLKSSCEKLDMGRSIGFVPVLAGRLHASLHYEVRDAVGQPCDISRVEQIPTERATQLKASLADKS